MEVEELHPPVIPPVKSRARENIAQGETSATTDCGGTLSTVAVGAGHAEPRGQVSATVSTSSPGTMCFKILLDSPGGANFRILPDTASSSKEGEFNLSIGQGGEICINRNRSNG